MFQSMKNAYYDYKLSLSFGILKTSVLQIQLKCRARRFETVCMQGPEVTRLQLEEFRAPARKWYP